MSSVRSSFASSTTPCAPRVWSRTALPGAEDACKTAAEHQRQEERQGFVVSYLNGDETKLLSQAEGTSMCEMIVAEMEHANNVNNDAPLNFLLPLGRVLQKKWGGQHKNC